MQRFRPSNSLFREVAKENDIAFVFLLDVSSPARLNRWSFNKRSIEKNAFGKCVPSVFET
jgi:hypothetical protein